MLYLHEGRPPATITIAAANRGGDRLMSYNDCQPHGRAVVTKHERFEFANDFESGMVIELLSWRYSGNTSRLEHNGRFELKNGCFKCTSCMCISWCSGTSTRMVHKATMLLLTTSRISTAPTMLPIADGEEVQIDGSHLCESESESDSDDSYNFEE